MSICMGIDLLTKNKVNKNFIFFPPKCVLFIIFFRKYMTPDSFVTVQIRPPSPTLTVLDTNN